MEIEVPRAWVRIRLHARPDGSLATSGESFTGSVIRPPGPDVPTVGWATQGSLTGSPLTARRSKR